MTEFRAGERFGCWSLVGDQPLGHSPNAEVWAAVSDDGREGALKALRRRAGARRLGRFADEIKFLLANPERAGIVPLYDAHLPESVTRHDRPWMVMSRCTPLRKALAEEPGGVEAVVDAIATIAETLAGLANEAVHHRDVKPGNLFARDGEWLVGDFGLVDYPDKPEVTARGERMGPMHFMAPEMIEFTDEADAELADVYSLAKSLWSLLTGVNFPPPGPHRMGDAAYAAGSFVSHERIAPLDLLIARATRHSPRERPRMAELAVELRVWEAGPPDIRAGDLSAYAREAQALLAPDRVAEEERTAAVRAAQEASVGWHRNYRPRVEEALRAALGDVDAGSNNTVLEVGIEGSPGPIIWQEGAAVAVQRTLPTPVYYWAGFGIQLGPQLDELHIVIGHIVQSNAGRQVVSSASRRVVLGSAEQGVAMAELTQQLIDDSPRAVEVFIAALRE